MAERDTGDIFAGFGRRNRDTDIDARPGNPGESKAYAKMYDLHSESEYTNRPETSSQIIASDQILKSPPYGDVITIHEPSTQFFPSVGKFIIPTENTWAAHAELVKDPQEGLAFNPQRYVYFDKLVAEAFPEINDAKYEGLRTNIAVMRNDIIGFYLHDGSFDPGDEKFVPYIAGVARGIGRLLANDRFGNRVFMKHVNRDVANVEGVGAREIYKGLLDMQVKPGHWNDFKVLLGNYDTAWGLPPVEATPYSDINLAAPPPAKFTCPPCAANEPQKRFVDTYLNECNRAPTVPVKGC